MSQKPEKVQQEWYDGVYARNPQLWAAVDAMLLLMMKAGLPMPSERLRGFDLQDPETVGLYVMDLADAGIELGDVMADGHEVRRSLRWFPSSAELVNAMRALKHKRNPPGVINDPVYVCEDGRVCVTSRRNAINKGLPYWASMLDCEYDNGLRRRPAPLPEGTTLKELAATIEARIDGAVKALPASTAPKPSLDLEQRKKIEEEIQLQAEVAKARREQRDKFVASLPAERQAEARNIMGMEVIRRKIEEQGTTSAAAGG